MADEITEKTTYTDRYSLLVGRLPIYTTISGFSPNNPAEIVTEVNEALSIHATNILAMEDLYWRRRGITPIWGKTKTVREEINNKVNVNIAEEIVSFKNGYFMTQPAFYTSRKKGDEIQEKIDKLNDYLYLSGKQEADNKLIDWFHTVGKADLFVRSNDDTDIPFKAYALDPRSAFVVRSLAPGNKPVYAVYTIAKGDELTLSVWDEQNVYTLAGTITAKTTSFDHQCLVSAGGIIDIQPNPLKRIPIIEYYYNSVQMGAFEAVAPLLDAINALQSDRLDGVDQFIQSLLVFYNCELGEDEDGNPITPQLIRAMGAVFLKSIGENKADLKEISSQLDQSQIQVFIDNLYNEILRICGMPIIDGKMTGNHSTGMVALVDNGWYQADAVARNTADLFRESNREFDEIITMILREKGLLDINPAEFKLNFVRNETANIQSKAQAAQIMLAMGMHPELAFKKSGISNDPVADMEMSEKYLKMIWGDPDAPSYIESEGEEAALDYTDEDPQAQARADENLAINRPEAMNVSNQDGNTGTKPYYRVRNGKRERVSGYVKRKKVEVQ